jgi:hypothetical protein
MKRIIDDMYQETEGWTRVIICNNCLKSIGEGCMVHYFYKSTYECNNCKANDITIIQIKPCNCGCNEIDLAQLFTNYKEE